jgi:hypothetical protein
MHELYARVDAAPSFIPLEGNWRDGLDLLDVPLDEHGVGFALKGLVTLETVTRFRTDVDEAIRAIGPCLVRTVAGDEPRRL